MQDTCGGDDVSYQVALPTAITFQGDTYTAVYATTNSTIVFGQQDNAYWDFPQSPSISVNAYDWVVLDPANQPQYPSGWRAEDEHLIITSSQSGFQIDLAVRPYGYNANANPLSTIVVTASINPDSTLTITYLSDVQTGLNTRTGVRLPNGTVVSLEDAGLTRVYVAPVIDTVTGTVTTIVDTSTVDGTTATVDSTTVQVDTGTAVPGPPPVPPVPPAPAPDPVVPPIIVIGIIETLPPTEILLPTQAPEIESPPLAEDPPPPAEEPPAQEIVSPEPQNPLEESPPQDTAPLTVDQIETIIDNLVSDGVMTESDSHAILENLRADGEITSSEVNALSDVLSADGQFTEAERVVVADALIEAAAGEAVTKEDIKDAGLTYEDLPPTTPVEVRQDEKGNEVIITAEVAAALVVLESPAAFISAAFNDPGQALTALSNIGADMSEAERTESEKMVVSAIIASNAAINAVGVAASAAGTATRTGSTPSAPKGGGAAGGSIADPKIRRRKP